MFIYRGEKLKDKDYYKKQRNRHKEELDYEISLCKKKIKQLDKNIEDISNNVGKIHNIISVKKLTDEEKKILINHIRHEIVKLYDEIDRLKNDYDNTIVIALDRNEINKENTDAIIKMLIFSKDKISSFKVFVDNVNPKKNDDGVDYMFTKTDVEFLLQMDGCLKKANYPGISVLELLEIEGIENIELVEEESFSLEQVIDANNRIDEYVKYIKDNDLYPFEAILYIHKVVSNYVCNTSGLEYLQEGRVLPSIFSKEYIVCSGYASMVKAIVDRVNLPGLKCDLLGCYLIDENSRSCHCHNLISIEDDEYGIKGVYVEDASWDSRKPDSKVQRGFAHCLYSVNDLMHFRDYKYNDCKQKDRLSNIITNRPNEIENFFYKVSRTLNKKDVANVVKKYKNNSEPIPVEKYVKALSFLYKFNGDSNNEIKEKIGKDIENSIKRAVNTFSDSSSNSFLKILTKEKNEEERVKL